MWQRRQRSRCSDGARRKALRERESGGAGHAGHAASVSVKGFRPGPQAGQACCVCRVSIFSRRLNAPCRTLWLELRPCPRHLSIISAVFSARLSQADKPALGLTSDHSLVWVVFCTAWGQQKSVAPQSKASVSFIARQIPLRWQIPLQPFSRTEWRSGSELWVWELSPRALRLLGARLLCTLTAEFVKTASREIAAPGAVPFALVKPAREADSKP